MRRLFALVLVALLVGVGIVAVMINEKQISLDRAKELLEQN